jgi:hypothetical protein
MAWFRALSENHPVRRLDIGPASPQCPETMTAADQGPVVTGIGCSIGDVVPTAPLAEVYAREALSGRAFIYKPLYISPSVLIKREFHETSLTESVGTLSRTYLITYERNYWCKSHNGAKQCFAVSRTRYNSNDAYNESQRNPHRGPCQYLILGQLESWVPAPLLPPDSRFTGPNARAGKNLSHAGRLASIFDDWGKSRGDTRLSSTDAKAVSEFWELMDTLPELREDPPKEPSSVGEDLLKAFLIAAAVSILLAPDNPSPSSSQSGNCTSVCPAGTSGGPYTCSYPPCRQGQVFGCGAIVPAEKQCF